MKVCEAAVSNSSHEHWAVPDEVKDGREFILNPPEPELVLDYEIESRNYAKAGKASSDIKLTLKQLGVDPSVLRKIAIACYEAEINVVAHSKGGKMHANIYDDRVLVILEDEGPGIEDVEKAMLPGFSTADELAREMGFGAGLGLPNIKKNCDAMHISSRLGYKTRLNFFVLFDKLINGNTNEQ